MIDFFVRNSGTIIVSAILALTVVLIIRKMHSDRKKGKSCSCGCENCSLNCTNRK